MRRWILAALGVALFATMAWAVTPNDWIQSGGSDTQLSTNKVSVDGHIVYKFDENHGSGGTGIGNAIFHVEGPRASCNLERDINGTGGTVVLELRACGTGIATYDLAHCGQVVKTFTTDDDQPLSRGSYLLNVTTAVGAGEDAIFSCRGYE